MILVEMTGVASYEYRGRTLFFGVLYSYRVVYAIPIDHYYALF